MQHNDATKIIEPKETTICPLTNQTGNDGILNFDAIIKNLNPELRQAFEDERNRCLAST